MALLDMVYTATQVLIIRVVIRFQMPPLLKGNNPITISLIMIEVKILVAEVKQIKPSMSVCDILHHMLQLSNLHHVDA